MVGRIIGIGFEWRRWMVCTRQWVNERRVSTSRGTHSVGGASSEVIGAMNEKLHGCAVRTPVRGGGTSVASASLEKLLGGKLIAALTSPRT